MSSVDSVKLSVTFVIGATLDYAGIISPLVRREVTQVQELHCSGDAISVSAN